MDMAETLFGPNKPFGLLPWPSLLTLLLITNAMSSLGEGALAHALTLITPAGTLKPCRP